MLQNRAIQSVINDSYGCFISKKLCIGKFKKDLAHELSQIKSIN